MLHIEFYERILEAFRVVGAPTWTGFRFNDQAADFVRFVVLTIVSSFEYISLYIYIYCIYCSIYIYIHIWFGNYLRPVSFCSALAHGILLRACYCKSVPQIIHMLSLGSWFLWSCCDMFYDPSPVESIHHQRFGNCSSMASQNGVIEQI